MKSFVDQLSDLYSVFAAAKQTLRDNLHLTDGDNCTLLELRNAVEKVDPLWRNENEKGGSMSKHTPGNWYIAGPPFHVMSDHEGVIEDTHTVVCRASNVNDARLIAAAPELLSACEGLLNALPSATTHPAIKAARSAIAKAKGELGEIQIRRKTSYS